MQARYVCLCIMRSADDAVFFCFFASLALRCVQRLLDLIVPDFVHVMIEGKIVQTGGKARAAHTPLPLRRPACLDCCTADFRTHALSLARCAGACGAAGAERLRGDGALKRAPRGHTNNTHT
jgi:hypothetical protein